MYIKVRIVILFPSKLHILSVCRYFQPFINAFNSEIKIEQQRALPNENSSLSKNEFLNNIFWNGLTKGEGANGILFKVKGLVLSETVEASNEVCMTTF